MNFSDMRDALRTISAAVGPGYLISCGWNGTLMRVAVVRDARGPEPWRKPWVMTFDDDADFSADPTELVSRLAHEARVWFGSSKEQADEIERLCKLAEAERNVAH